MTTFAEILLRWFAENGRDLPWRHTSDPYAIWLSEIILQQTQVKQGLAYWERFMSRWPTVQMLAAATEDEVLREWQGLGYYSRARNLHFAAGEVVQSGGFPNTFEGLRSLKGVGDYTAAAIASIAYGEPVAVVDGNVFRVLSRHFGIDVAIDTTEGKKTFTQLAQQLIPNNEPSAYNQAIMDFGAVQCTPHSPACMQCPLQETCAAWRENRVSLLPVKQKTTKTSQRRLIYVYVRHQGLTAVHRRGAGDIWQGLYEPWLTEHVPAGALLLRQNVKHVLTHRIILADFWLWEPQERPTLPPEYIWTEEAELDRLAKPRLIETLLQCVDAHLGNRQ